MTQQSVHRLYQEQSALLGALLGGQGADSLAEATGSTSARAAINQRGLQAYLANGQALAVRALGAAYPVIAQLIGNDNFTPLAHHFWRQHPPQRGDMGQWGGLLAEFLDAAPQLAEEPFLGDVARLEWATHRAAFAQDAQPDYASFELLTGPYANRAGLALSPGVCLLDSRYPVVSMIEAHRSATPDLEPAARKLAVGEGERALVWRQGFKPMLRTTSAGEHALLALLQARACLADALEAAFQAKPERTGGINSSAAFDLNTWLPLAVQSGLVTGAFIS